MIQLWRWISGLIALVLLALLVMSIMLLMKDSKSRFKHHLLEAIAFGLLLMQTIVVYFPVPGNYADYVILFKLLAATCAYIMLGVVAFLHLKLLLDKKKHKTHKHKKN